MNQEITRTDEMISSLKEMVFILSGDRSCRWCQVFSKLLAGAELIRAGNSPEDEMQVICRSILNAYSGVKSFSEYTPVEYNPEAGCFIPISGTEEFSSVSENLRDTALKLLSDTGNIRAE